MSDAAKIERNIYYREDKISSHVNVHNCIWWKEKKRRV